MLTEQQQDRVKVDGRLFSSSRGIQIRWLQQDSYAEGMPAAARKDFDAAIDEGVAEWEKGLAEAEAAVSLLRNHRFTVR